MLKLSHCKGPFTAARLIHLQSHSHLRCKFTRMSICKDHAVCLSRAGSVVICIGLCYSCSNVVVTVPLGTYVLDLWLSVLCMRSKAWLAARVSLRLARLPRTASSAQRSGRLRSTRAAAPVLLARAEVTKNVIYFFNGSKTESVKMCFLHMASNNTLHQKDWRCRKRGTQAT